MEKTKIKKYNPIIIDSDYDITAELTVAQFDLDLPNRTVNFIDIKQYFTKWWFDNRSQFVRYKTYMAFAELLKLHHATVIHLVKRRKASYNYDDNIKNIKEFLYYNE